MHPPKGYEGWTPSCSCRSGLACPWGAHPCLYVHGCVPHCPLCSRGPATVDRCMCAVVVGQGHGASMLACLRTPLLAAWALYRPLTHTATALQTGRRVLRGGGARRAPQCRAHDPNVDRRAAACAWQRSGDAAQGRTSTDAAPCLPGGGRRGQHRGQHKHRCCAARRLCPRPFS